VLTERRGLFAFPTLRALLAYGAPFADDHPDVRVIHAAIADAMEELMVKLEMAEDLGRNEPTL
jgi:hypothetical protein